MSKSHFWFTTPDIIVHSVIYCLFIQDSSADVTSGHPTGLEFKFIFSWDGMRNFNALGKLTLQKF